MKERFTKLPPIWTREIRGDNPRVLSVADAEKESNVYVKEAIAKERTAVLDTKLRIATLPAELLLIGDAQKLDILRRAEEPEKRGFNFRKEASTQEFTTESFAVHNGELYPFQMTYHTSGKNKERKVLPKNYVQMLKPHDRFVDWRLMYPYLRLSFAEENINSLHFHLTSQEVKKLEKDSFLKNLHPDQRLDISLDLSNTPKVYIISGSETRFGGGGNYTFDPEKNHFELERKFRKGQPTSISVDTCQGLVGEMLAMIPSYK